METYLIIGLTLLTTCLWFWALINITKSRFKDLSMKSVWLLIVLFFPIIGSIFYFQLRKRLITKESREFRPNFSKT
jgi:uncharacterized membrane protein YhaH (DUF805 family)